MTDDTQFITVDSGFHSIGTTDLSVSSELSLDIGLINSALSAAAAPLHPILCHLCPRTEVIGFRS